MVAAIRQTLARGALALPAPMRPQQWLNLLNRLGHPTQTKRHADHGAHRHGAGVVTVSGALPAGRSDQERPPDGAARASPSPRYRARWRRPDAASASPQRMTLARGRLSCSGGSSMSRCPDARGAGLRAVPSKPRHGPRRLPHGGAWASAPRSPDVRLADGVCPAWRGPSRSGVPPVASGSCTGAPSWRRGSSLHILRGVRRMRPAPLGSPTRGKRAWGQPGDAYNSLSAAPGRPAPGTAIAPALREGSARPVPDRMTEGGPTVTSIARGGKNLVRPHPYAVSPTKCYRKRSGRAQSTAGSLLSTSDSILICSVNQTGLFLCVPPFPAPEKRER